MIYYLKIQDYIKIGFTDNVEVRLKQYNGHLPIDAELLAVTHGDRNAEKNIHIKLTEYLHKGEWVKDCKEVRDFIDKLEVINHKDYDNTEERITKSDTLVLIEMYKRLDENGEVLIPTRVRNDISKITGVHTTNISKTLAKLRRLGYIEGERGCFNILKMVPIPIELH